MNQTGKASTPGTTVRGGNRHYTQKTVKNLHYRLLCVLGRETESAGREEARGPGLPEVWTGKASLRQELKLRPGD